MAYFSYGGVYDDLWAKESIFYGEGDWCWHTDYTSNGLDLLGDLNNIPPYQGIYLFFHIPTETYNYIGSSNNLQERIKTHLGLSKIFNNGNKELYFDFYKSPKEYQVQCLLCENNEEREYRMIDLEKPKFNILGKGR